MKTLFAAVLAATAIASIATAADARPHHRHPVKVCSVHHHHRVCRTVYQ